MSPSGDKDVQRRAAASRRAALALDPATGPALAAAVAPLLRASSRVAAYVSFGTEPPTDALVAAVEAAGADVLLPVLLPDRDLDWSLGPGGVLLGVDAVATCDLVVVPALAVDRQGVRLGRGGGSYDRALARVPAGVLTVALLHDGELVDALPCEPHDVPVAAVATPTGGLEHLREPFGRLGR